MSQSAVKATRAMLARWQGEHPQTVVQVLVDPQLEPFGCKIESELGRIELGLRKQLATTGEGAERGGVDTGGDAGHRSRANGGERLEVVEPLILATDPPQPDNRQLFARKRSRKLRARSRITRKIDRESRE